MEVFLEYLIQYGYWILLAWVLLDQLALPVPAMPMILAAGGLAGWLGKGIWIWVCVSRSSWSRACLRMFCGIGLVSTTATRS
jgi:hypothetical protein